MFRIYVFVVVVAAMSAVSSTTVAATVNIRQAIALAVQQDPWLSGSQLRQQAFAASGVAAAELPDPVISLGMANLPLDTFDFDQEGMSQFKIGISQAIPRGQSRALKQQRFAILGEQQLNLRAERRAQLALSVSELWLDAWQAQQSMHLIGQDRVLFVDLAEVAQSSYASAFGQTRQNDVIRAQLELTRLDDRLTQLRQQRDTALGALLQWLGDTVEISTGEPDMRLLAEEGLRADGTIDINWLSQLLRRHPSVLGLDQSIAVSEVEVDLARQKYKPQWGVNAGYGYRQDAPDGMERPDFLSVGVSFDLPLFTGLRQDQQLRAASARAGAGRTDKALALRRLRAGFEGQYQRLLQLVQRQRLYSERLLAQLHDQAEIALSAYTSDEGDFAEVVRARIDELNARVEVVAIRAERQRSIARLNYYLAGMDNTVFVETESELQQEQTP
ncbi:MAG: TolC family protein [Parahaliea sp.]